MNEATYLRAELIRAKSILAACEGLFEAATTIAPDFGKLEIVGRTVQEIREFQTHGIAVLPEGVSA